jgi:hypothetical protein
MNKLKIYKDSSKIKREDLRDKNKKFKDKKIKHSICCSKLKEIYKD